MENLLRKVFQSTITSSCFDLIAEFSYPAMTTESISISVRHAQQAPQDEQQQQPQPQEETETTIITQETTLPTHATTSAIENEALEGTGSPPADSEEVPHARGPPVVGVEDMGLQDGKGVEMPLSNVDNASDAPSGNNATKEPAQEKDDEDPKQDSASASEEGKKDSDGDISLDDAKKNENESSTGSSNEEQKKQ